MCEAPSPKESTIDDLEVQEPIQRWWPVIAFLIIGLLGILTALLTELWWPLPASLTTISIIGSAVATFCALLLTFHIARIQRTEAQSLATAVGHLNTIASDTQSLLRRSVESQSRDEYGQEEEETSVQEEDDDTPARAHASDGDPRPSYEAEAIKALAKHNANLDWENLRWRPRQKPEGGRGNLGWFVENKKTRRIDGS